MVYLGAEVLAVVALDREALAELARLALELRAELRRSVPA